MTSRLEQALGYTFQDQSLLRRALAHRSAVAENLAPRSFERMEFLGDAVLGLAVTHHMFAAYPDLREGEMAKTRAAVVGEPALARLATRLGLGEEVVLGRGEEQSGGRTKPSILSDALEAVIAAVYLDGGYRAAAAVVERFWGPMVAERVKAPGGRDFKSRLQETLAAEGRSPEYTWVAEGPDHAKTFTVSVMVDMEILGTGVGTSKKRAEQEAAAAALERLS